MVFKIKKQLFISFILSMSELSVFAVKWQTHNPKRAAAQSEWNILQFVILFKLYNCLHNFHYISRSSRCELEH